jgi:methylisocitrate lyase
MLYPNVTAADKRAAFRERLASGELLRFPGAFNPLSARVTSLPVIVDADTGFGEPLNVARTVQTLEDAGVAGIHLEDQVNPKRCGHLDGKQVVGLDAAVKRIRAAVDARRDPNFLIIARTDARGVDGLDAAVSRAHLPRGRHRADPRRLRRGGCTAGHGGHHAS